jgi:hypothetical protein
MTIDWAHFTPWPSLFGGLLIGLAAAMAALLLGRIAGISGIVSGLLKPFSGDVGWRAAFVLGMLLAPTLWAMFAPLPSIEIDTSNGVLIVAGLLVGIGTRYGSGCTSGHGVCGLSRLSPRSMVATATFMLAGFVTVYVVRHLLGA